MAGADGAEAVAEDGFDVALSGEESGADEGEVEYAELLDGEGGGDGGHEFDGVGSGASCECDALLEGSGVVEEDSEDSAESEVVCGFDEGAADGDDAIDGDVCEECAESGLVFGDAVDKVDVEVDASLRVLSVDEGHEELWECGEFTASGEDDGGVFGELLEGLAFAS